MALSQTQVSALYVAIFNRASEGEGNSFWQSFSGDAANTADTMLATPAAISYFGASLNSNQAFIEHIYLNTLNKTTADDPAGIAFWVGRLDSGEARGVIIADLVFAAQQPANAGAAQDRFNNRLAVSDHTADVLHSTPSDFAVSLAFDQDLVVTSDSATVASANTAVDGLILEGTAGNALDTALATKIQADETVVAAAAEVSANSASGSALRSAQVDFNNNRINDGKAPVLYDIIEGELPAPYIVVDGSGNLVLGSGVSEATDPGIDALLAAHIPFQLILDTYTNAQATAATAQTAVDYASAPFTDAGFATPVSLNAGSNAATSGNDIFFATSTVPTSNITGFESQGEDALYIGNSYTLGAGGDNAVLEVFLTASAGDTVVSLETTADNSTSATAITLTGVALADVVLENGVISIT